MGAVEDGRGGRQPSPRTAAPAGSGPGGSGCSFPTAGRRRRRAGAARRPTSTRPKPHRPTSASPGGAGRAARRCPARERSLAHPSAGVRGRLVVHLRERYRLPSAGLRSLGRSKTIDIRLHCPVAGPVGTVFTRLMEPVVHLATPSRCSAASRHWPASASTSQRGEIVLLQGANGAGKTTLLRTCAGLLPVGRAWPHVLGHDLDRRDVRSTSAARPRHRPLRRADRRGQRPLLGPRGRRRRRRRWHGLAARPGRSARRTGWAACRPASGAAPPSPCWWPAGRSCGCWTSPTPGSTPRPRPGRRPGAPAADGGRHRGHGLPRARRAALAAGRAVAGESSGRADRRTLRPPPVPPSGPSASGAPGHPSRPQRRRRRRAGQ